MYDSVYLYVYERSLCEYRSRTADASLYVRMHV